jgi:hypothetical protein
MRILLVAAAVCAAASCADSDDETGLEPGDYSLSWECVDGCNLWLAATLWDGLELERDVAWFREEQTVSRRSARVEWTDDGCAELPDGIPNGAEQTDPTMLCLTPDGVAEAMVTYAGPAGDAPRTWRVTAVPVSAQ